MFAMVKSFAYGGEMEYSECVMSMVVILSVCDQVSPNVPKVISIHMTKMF